MLYGHQRTAPVVQSVLNTSLLDTSDTQTKPKNLLLPSTQTERLHNKHQQVQLASMCCIGVSLCRERKVAINMSMALPHIFMVMYWWWLEPTTSCTTRALLNAKIFSYTGKILFPNLLSIIWEEPLMPQHSFLTIEHLNIGKSVVHGCLICTSHVALAKCCHVIEAFPPVRLRKAIFERRGSKSGIKVDYYAGHSFL